jgi:hypothetical protein
VDDYQEVAIPQSNHVLLEANKHGSLTTLRHSDGLLSTNPVGYVWDGQRIRISSLKSRLKYHNIAADSRACFMVISPQNIMEYVEIRGFASLEEDPDRAFFREQFIRGAGVEPPDDLDPPEAERVIITIHPLQVSSPRLYGGRLDQRQD